MVIDQNSLTIATLNAPRSVQFEAEDSVYTVIVTGISGGSLGFFGLNVTGSVFPITNYIYDGVYRLTAADRPATANDEAFTYERRELTLQVSAGRRAGEEGKAVEIAFLDLGVAEGYGRHLAATLGRGRQIGARIASGIVS